MSQPETEHPVPDWSLGWRLRRALEWGEVSAKAMAAELDVSEGTVSRWCHDVGAPPRAIYLRAWATKCRVPADWLIGQTGAESDERSSRPQHLQLDLERPTKPEILSLRKQLHGDRRGALNRRAEGRVTA